MKSKYVFKAHNLLLLAVVALLNFLGILILQSASNMDTAIVSKQIFASLTGYAVCTVIMFLDYNRIMRYSNIIYAVTIGILLAVIIMGVAHKGAGRWIVLPVIGQIQPAEFAKVGIILFFAALFGKREGHINEPRILIPSVLLFGLAAILVFVEPNLSTTLILCVIFSAMLFTAGLDIRIVLAVLVVGGLLTAFIMFLFSTDKAGLIPFIKDYQKERIMSFLYPDQYSDTFFQQRNSIMAIGSGGYFGKGLFNTDISSVKAGNFLIEEDTDFIFAIIGEELGFRGCMGIICAYILLILLMLWIAMKSKNLSGAIICTGTAAWIGFQTFTNIAVAIALFPNTGVTLPFFSRGASSLLALYIGVGIVLNVGMQSKD
ncbi:MAG: FtsW/RodA/SpoVE family cell cycle protein [Clostridiales bacterium]|nr:FtsW/RodA/SpoVE family cell cycle protein [Clostridiales bacterium]